jgi:hypothetical protein
MLLPRSLDRDKMSLRDQKHLRARKGKTIGLCQHFIGHNRL